MGCLYVAGIVTSWAWQWLIITVEQGTLKKIRDDMFAHQQKLPIRYFDSHEHGDIMSHYTNDTDTLRQAISQSFRRCSPRLSPRPRRCCPCCGCPFHSPRS